MSAQQRALFVPSAAGGGERRRAPQLAPATTAAAPAYRGALRLVREPGSTYSAPPPRLSRPASVARWLWPILEQEPGEVFGALYLDSAGHPIGHVIAYRGGLSRSVAEPRGILAPALLLNAASLALFHNHPSGDPAPSREDLAVTRRMADAAHLLGVELVDHLILGSGSAWTSLRERGGW
jgi:DNA repair protein RadC